MRTLFTISLLLALVASTSAHEDNKALFSTWAPWFAQEEELEDAIDNKKKWTLTSKRRKDTEDKPKEISAKKITKKVFDAKAPDIDKKKKSTMTSKRRKDTEDSLKEISAKKVKKVVDAKALDVDKKAKKPGWFSRVSFEDATENFE
mmetsp:Transcript_12857/g.21338  ORF Transcript_12857/g.21338 Transcript_12857/m.21338 type:complete len:147 (+) Transcript_12857:37-477(+)|eukprot:CAMPEP_0119014500 /NCGR_PEP_ID=MMETSP1176-20130426/9848_1 /TAXON_ID=265551 /ORGANISM="Synedropsis recta cf, Strain CCMP1620" /LENGTH=146 /DNA_ID=CAMNT_0006967689 /DNA_START=35 /DNA_END=475 /DNA_ORIENTATION=-